MDGGKKVWAPHPTEGFKQGRIVDLGADAISVEPFDSPGQVRLEYIYKVIVTYRIYPPTLHLYVVPPKIIVTATLY